MPVNVPSYDVNRAVVTARHDATDTRQTQAAPLEEPSVPLGSPSLFQEVFHGQLAVHGRACSTLLWLRLDACRHGAGRPQMH
eukprot:8683296-Alexandrium_andersonii.AAC.1